VIQYAGSTFVLTTDDNWPKVTIIVLNWNGKADTVECLRSLGAIAYPNFEVVVVDNGSQDDSVKTIRQSFPDLQIMETGANLGYAGGNNVGIREAMNRGAEYLLLLNNDTVVDGRMLQAFVQAARDFPDGALYAAKVYYYGEPTKIWYAGAKWMESRSNFAHLGDGVLDTGAQFNEICETDFAQGFALFVRGAAL
jgi:GT2 family glycosyltransferase